MTTIYSLPGTIKQVIYKSEYDQYSFVVARDDGGSDFTVIGFTRAVYSEGDRVEWREYYGAKEILRKI
jgi:hypothetical protein